MDALIKQFLQEHILFKDYANQEFITSLAKQMKPRMFVDGAYIIRKNEIGKAMFFNLKGTVEVISDDGETVINVMEEGSFFGEIGVLFSVPRTVSCRSRGKSIILTLTKEALDDTLKPYPQIAKSIALIAEERYQSHLKKRESSVGEEFGEELNLSITYNDLQEVSIFKDANIEFLHKLTLSLKPIKFYQNQYIIKKGDLAKEMYFLVKGNAHVVDEVTNTTFAQFTPGSFFGEVGLLLEDNRRTASVKCASDHVLLFKCEKSALDQLILEFPEVRQSIEQEMKRRLEYIRHREKLSVNGDIALATEIETIREKLKAVPIFREASISFLHQLASQMRVKRYSPNVIIVRQGDVANSMFFIIDGTVQVTSLDEKVVYAEMKQDSFFGEVSLFYDTNRTATVKSKTECTLIELRKKELEETLKTYPGVKSSILNVAAENYAAHCARQNFSLGQSCVGSSIEATTEKLKSIHLFRSCDEGFLRSLAVKTTIKVCKEGDIVVEEGDDSAELFFVNQGSVHIVSKDRSNVFDTVQAGDFFGEVGVLHGWKRTATVKAGADDTILMVLSVSDLALATKKYPDSLQEIIIAGNQRIGKAKQRNEKIQYVNNSNQEGLLEIVQSSIHCKEKPEIGAVIMEEQSVLKALIPELPVKQVRKVVFSKKLKAAHGPPQIKHILDADDAELKVIFSRIPSRSLPLLMRVCKQWYMQLSTPEFWRTLDLQTIYSSFTANMFNGLIEISGIHVRHLNLSNCWKLEDKAMETIATNCNCLHFLSITNCWRLTDTGISHIGTISSLENLEMMHCSKVRGTGFSEHALKKLKSLEISFCPITDRNFEKLVQNTPELESIRMKRCIRITDYGMFLIARFCRYILLIRNIQKIDITDSEQYTDRCLKWLASACPQIKELHFSFCKGFTIVGFQEWVGFPQQFELLDFSNCSTITNNFFSLLRPNLTKLKTLRLRNCRKISDMVAVYLAFCCKDLRLLDVRGCPLVRSESIKRIFGATNKLIKILVDVPPEDRGIIPIGFPGKDRALELALTDLYRGTVSKFKEEKVSKSIGEKESGAENLNVKRFIKAKMKKSKKSNSGSLERLDSPKSPGGIRSPLIDKRMISSPSNFQHLAHVDLAPDATKLQSPLETIKQNVIVPPQQTSERQDSKKAHLDSLKASISGPSNFQHISHADTPLDVKTLLAIKKEGSSSNLMGPTMGKELKLTHILAKKLHNLWSLSTRTARQTALRVELAQLQKSEQQALRTSYLIRESQVATEKRSKMSMDDFEVIGILGHGGFGVVRLVKETQTGEIYAIKSLAKHMTMERNQSEHVKAERRILSIASEFGDWIVRLFYSFQDPMFLHFVLEYMPGGDLLGLLIKKDVFEEDFARFYMAEIVMAVEEVHKLGTIHRDIKPDNFLFDRTGHLKLADFGLATDTKPNEENLMTIDENNEEVIKDRKHQAYSVVGTNNYVAPEVLRGAGYDKGCDWWSVGIIMFEMLFGYPPFSSRTPTVTREKIKSWKNFLQRPESPICSDPAWDLITNLICNEEDRMGKKVLDPIPNEPECIVARMLEEGDASDIKSHPWFDGIKWDELQSQTPPFIPQLADETDTSHFDEIDDERVQDLLSVDKTIQNTEFEGFSYLAPNPLSNAVDRN